MRLSGTPATFLVAVVLLTLIPFQLVSASAVTVLDPVTEADGRLGLCDVLPGSPPGAGSPTWAQLASNAGARLNRWEIRWDRVEPKRGQWNFSSDDAAVSSSVKSGLDVLGILIGTPRWARAAGQKPGNGVPKGLSLPIDDPGNVWAGYVRQTVTHYSGMVHYWEIWNEPDLSFFWSGSSADYALLLQVAYQVIKAVDPSAKVVMAGMVAPDLAFVTQVLDALRLDPSAARLHDFFDIFAWHAYGNASAVFSNVTRLRTLLATHGQSSTPIWITEDGFPSSNPNGEPRQAAYVLQTIVYALAAGASRVLVYRESDDRTAKTFGLMTANGTPRMGYVAYQVAARYFSHTIALVHAPTPDLERFTFYLVGQRITVLWTHGLSARQIDVPADEPSATLVDWQGNVSPVAAVDGLFHLTLPGAPYNVGVDPQSAVVGAEPVLLVEDNQAPVGLVKTGYITPVPGANRGFVAFNHSDTIASILVVATRHPHERATLQIPPHAVRRVDLDLLAGPKYQGLYSLAATAPLSGQAVSDNAVVPARSPAKVWYMPSAPAVLVLGGVPVGAAKVTIKAFGAKGVLRAKATVHLAANVRSDWSLPPELLGRPMALMIQANRPVVVGANGAETQPALDWYAIHPRPSGIELYNPDPHKAASVDMRYIGANAVTGEQVEIPPHGSVASPSYGAHAIVATASQPVVASYLGAAAPAYGVPSTPATQSSLALAGSSTGVALFNPAGSTTAHVTLTFVNGTTATPLNRTLKPRQVYTVPVRTRTGPARGVEVTSDVAIVAAPS